MTQLAAPAQGTGTDSALRDALQDANIPSLLMALVQLTGEVRWLEPPYRPARPRGLDDNDSGGLSATIQQEIRQAVFEAVQAFRDGRLSPAEVSADDVARMLEVALDESVPADYGPPLLEELGFRSRDIEMPSAPWKYLDYWQRTLEFDPADFRATPDTEAEQRASRDLEPRRKS